MSSLKRKELAHRTVTRKAFLTEFKLRHQKEKPLSKTFPYHTS
jgi:hypothetical protein